MPHDRKVRQQLDSTKRCLHFREKPGLENAKPRGWDWGPRRLPRTLQPGKDEGQPRNLGGLRGEFPCRRPRKNEPRLRVRGLGGTKPIRPQGSKVDRFLGRDVWGVPEPLDPLFTRLARGSGGSAWEVRFRGGVYIEKSGAEAYVDSNEFSRVVLGRVVENATQVISGIN
jgi:hypothetical protein